MSKTTIEGFIGKAMYDRDGTMIFGVNPEGGMQLILDVRGWGAIQHLFKSEKEACEFQDSMGQWIADAINDKLGKNLK